MDGIIHSAKITATIRLKYTCSVCHTSSYGTPTRYESDHLVTESEILSKFIAGNHVENAAMPIGWGHYGDGNYKCPLCSKSLNKSF